MLQSPNFCQRCRHPVVVKGSHGLHGPKPVTPGPVWTMAQAWGSLTELLTPHHVSVCTLIRIFLDSSNLVVRPGGGGQEGMFRASLGTALIESNNSSDVTEECRCRLTSHKRGQQYGETHASDPAMRLATARTCRQDLATTSDCIPASFLVCGERLWTGGK